MLKRFGTGHRRNIPYLWAFVTLAGLVSLSFGQNLFFIALLVTPVPLPDRDGSPLHHKTRTRNSVRSGALAKAGDAVKKSTVVTEEVVHTYWQGITTSFDHFIPSKAPAWTAYPSFYKIPLRVSFFTIPLIAFATNTPSFATVVLLHLTLLYLHLYVDRLVPERFGTTHSSIRDAHRASTPVFRLIALASTLLHLRQTLFALLDNEPGSHHHRHSSLTSSHKEHRSSLGRTSTAIGRVLGSLADHPAVAKVGWDVILCGLSLVVWATLRGLDVGKILQSVRLDRMARAVTTHIRESTNETMTEMKDKGKDLADDLLNPSPPPTPSPKRGRGRPKKGSSPTGPASPRKSTRKARTETHANSDTDDAYVPPTSVKHEVEQRIEGEDDPDENVEAGVLSWGLLALGGLGAAGAGVLGGEACS